PPLSVLHPSLCPLPPLSVLHPLSANPSTDLHSVVLHPSLPIPPLTSTQCPPPLSCQSLHLPPLRVLHPSLPIPPLTSTQCPPPLSANP
ncbi:unnamed protein product, partial [Staurois parvus]